MGNRVQDSQEFFDFKEFRSIVIKIIFIMNRVRVRERACTCKHKFFGHIIHLFLELNLIQVFPTVVRENKLVYCTSFFSARNFFLLSSRFTLLSSGQILVAMVTLIFLESFEFVHLKSKHIYIRDLFWFDPSFLLLFWFPTRFVTAFVVVI